MGAGEISIRRQQDIVNLFPFFFLSIFIHFILTLLLCTICLKKKKTKNRCTPLLSDGLKKVVPKNGSPDSWIKERERLAKNV